MYGVEGRLEPSLLDVENTEIERAFSPHLGIKGQYILPLDMVGRESKERDITAALRKDVRFISERRLRCLTQKLAPTPATLKTRVFLFSEVLHSRRSILIIVYPSTARNAFFNVQTHGLGTKNYVLKTGEFGLRTKATIRGVTTFSPLGFHHRTGDRVPR